MEAAVEYKNDNLQYKQGNKSELISALCKATLEFEPITKDSRAKVKTKSGSEYSYEYVSLDLIIISTRKALANNGLNVRHYIEFKEDGKSWLVSELRHSSGCEPDKTESPIDKFTGDSYMSIVQNYGSIMTYLRRYHMALLLNIAIDEDDDGNAKEQGKKQSETTKQSQNNTTKNNADNLDRITETEVNQILNDCRQAGLETETQVLNKVISILKKNIKSLAELTMLEYATVIKGIGSSKTTPPATNGNDADKNRKRAFAIANKLLINDEQISEYVLMAFSHESRKDMADTEWEQYCDYLVEYEKKPVTDEQMAEMKALPKPYADATLPKFLEFVNSNLVVAKEKTKDAKGNKIVHTPVTKLEHMQIWEADYIIRILKSNPKE